MTSASIRTLALLLCFALLGVNSAGAGEATSSGGNSGGSSGSPRESLKLVSLQLQVSGKTKEERVAAALKLLERAADAEGPGVYLLPEFSLCPLAGVGAVAANQEPVPGPMTAKFSEVARRRGLWVGVGLSETSPDPKRPYNAIALMGPQGQLYRYHKSHLFEPGNEGAVFRETQDYSPGESLNVFDVEGWRMGMMVCFDGNFPEAPRTLALKGAEVILYPNGRNIVLQEAEAASSANGVIVVVSNFVGPFGLGDGQGTSRIISPLPGLSAGLKGEQEGWVAQEFKHSEVDRWRKQNPPRARRPELYGILTEGADEVKQNLEGNHAKSTAAWSRIMVPVPACRTPWACVGKDCGNWGTYSRPACRAPQAKLKLVSLQMDVSGKSKEERLTAALKLLEKAADAEGPGVYVLPELALAPLPDAAASQEPVPGPMTKRISEFADKRKLWVVVGMSESSPNPKRPYNSIVVLGPHEQVFRYRKTHLDGAPGPGGFREDRAFTAGDALEVIDIEAWRVGLIAGGEENVPEVPRVLSLKGAQVLISCNSTGVVGTEADVASASNVAIMAVSNPVGHNGLVEGKGTSRILTPPQGLWAKPVTAPAEKEGWAAKEFDYGELERWRGLPVLGRCPTIDPRSRRPDLYGVLTAGVKEGK